MAKSRSGYVLLHWSAKDSRQADSAQEFGVWCWFLTSAALKERTLPDGRTLQRGQLLTSCRALSDRLQVPRQTLNRYMQKWEREGAINRQEVGRSGTIVTLCNFDTYQPFTNEVGTRASHEATASEPQDDRKVTHTEKPKKPKSPKKPKECAAVAADPTEVVSDEVLRKSLQGWFAYKAQRKDRYQPASIDTLIRKAVRESHTHGTEAVCGIIEDSISNNYAGIVWDRLSRGSPPKPRKTEAELQAEFHAALTGNP